MALCHLAASSSSHYSTVSFSQSRLKAILRVEKLMVFNEQPYQGLTPDQSRSNWPEQTLSSIMAGLPSYRAG